MVNLPDEELDAAFDHELLLAREIQQQILADITAKKFTDFELCGRLGCTPAGIAALKTRKTWTLRFAITTARKLGYEMSTVMVVGKIPTLQASQK